MKLATRLLLTLPFVVVTFLYLRLNLADNGCWGLIELMYSVILWILLAITFVLALVATLRKRQSEGLKAERFSLTITFLTLIALVFGGLWGDNLKGSVWLEAKTEGYISQHSSLDLTLRKNKTFTVHLNEVDFSCFYTGSYQNSNDTLHFDEETIANTDLKMTTVYLLHDGKLLPLVDTTKDDNRYTKFDIVTIQ